MHQKSGMMKLKITKQKLKNQRKVLITLSRVYKITPDEILSFFFENAKHSRFKRWVRQCLLDIGIRKENLTRDERKTLIIEGKKRCLMSINDYSHNNVRNEIRQQIDTPFGVKQIKGLLNIII